MTEKPEVLRTLGAAVRAIRARVDRALQTEGLRLGQYQVIRILWERDGRTPREIAAELGVEMPTITRTVQRMVRDGFVRREAHPGDARSVRIYVTPLGERLRDSVTRMLDRETEAALSGFSATERRTLVRLLERFAANARD